MTLLLSIFQLWIGMNAFAALCEPRDFRSQLGKAHDQDQLNICYSFPVTDALSIASGKKVSPQSVIIRYLQTRGQFENFAMGFVAIGGGKFQGGIGATALRAAQKLPVCSQTEMKGTVIREVDWSNLLKLHAQYRATFSPTEPTELIEKLCSGMQKIFTGVQVGQLRNLLKTSLTLDQLVGAALDQNCTEMKDQFANFTVQGDDFVTDPVRAQKGIDEALDAEQLPVVHLDPMLFHDLAPLPLPGGIPGLHVVSVSARKVVDGECMYLVRNSWGTNCEDVIDKVNQKIVTRYPARAKSRCEDGSFWYSADELKPYLKSTSWLKPK